MNIRRLLLANIVVLMVSTVVREEGSGFLPGCGLFCSMGIAQAADDTWLREMEDVCSKTGDSLAFSEEELKTLIGRCDVLKSRIEVLDETARKVYGKRLKMCRDLYQFMLDQKKDKADK